MLKRGQGYPSPLSLCVMTTATIFLGEVIVMFVLAAIPPLSVVTEAVVDGMMISVLMLPSLYFFLYKPMNLEIGRRRKAEEDLRVLNRGLEESVDHGKAKQRRTDERLETEMKLKRAARDEIWKDQELIRSIVEAAPCLFLIYDMAAHRCIFANSQIEVLLGYSPEEVSESERDFLKDVLSAEDYSDFVGGLYGPPDAGSATRDLGIIRMKKRSGEWQRIVARSVLLRGDPQGEKLEVLFSAIRDRD